MKGIYQLRPSLPKFKVMWDTSILSGKYQELLPHDQLDLKANIQDTDCCENRILANKESLPHYTFIVILFLEQEVKIRTFPLSLPRFSD